MFASLWQDVVNRGRLPPLLLVAFILTFFATRTIVRYIRHLSERDAPRRWWQPRDIRHGSLPRRAPPPLQRQPARRTAA